MPIKSIHIKLSLGAALALGGPAVAGTVSPVQSNASPFGLDPVAPVQVTGSDDDAATFNQNELGTIRSVVYSNLSESVEVAGIEALALDTSSLTLTYPADVRVYFVHEGAGYSNSLGVYTGDAAQALSGDAGLIFPNASSYNQTQGWISQRTPLLVGDFVDLGAMEAGTQLNLFLVSNGANGGSNTYYTDVSLNSDGLEHFVALATDDTDALIIGVEDLPGGGDKDYNDVVIALSIGAENVQELTSKAAPLPGPIVALLGLVLPVVRRKLRALKVAKA